MIHILENVFGTNIKFAQEWSFKLPDNDTWFDYEDLNYGNYLVDIARDFFHMQQIVGCEMHINHKTPLMHYDKDEGLFAETGKLSFPLCSIVWYPLVDMENGELIFPTSDVTVKPKTDMLVIFDSKLLHGGKSFTGIRKSVGINPWSKKPMTYNV